MSEIPNGKYKIMSSKTDVYLLPFKAGSVAVETTKDENSAGVFQVFSPGSNQGCTVQNGGNYIRPGKESDTPKAVWGKDEYHWVIKEVTLKFESGDENASEKIYKVFVPNDQTQFWYDRWSDTPPVGMRVDLRKNTDGRLETKWKFVKVG